MPIIHTERYELDPAPIGRGGFGEVYSATDLLFNRRVVVKTIVASQLYGIDQPTLRHQFFREALICARLGQKTPFIVKVFDYGYDRESDLPFFVMEFVNGSDLRSLVGKLTWEQTATVLDQMLEALSVAHEQGVVHSDISPDNIMFDQTTGSYKLNDFGLAKLLTSALTRRGSLLSLTGGKPGFLPLHDWQTGARTEHSDLYGLAATLLQLLTGKLPLWERVGGAYSAPDASTLFGTTDIQYLEKPIALPARRPDQGGRHLFALTIPPPKKDKNSYVQPQPSYVVKLLRRDLIALFNDVLSGAIPSVKEAVAFLQARTKENLAPKVPPPAAPSGTA